MEPELIKSKVSFSVGPDKKHGPGQQLKMVTATATQALHLMKTGEFTQQTLEDILNFLQKNQGKAGGKVAFHALNHLLSFPLDRGVSAAVQSMFTSLCQVCLTCLYTCERDLKLRKFDLEKIQLNIIGKLIEAGALASASQHIDEIRERIVLIPSTKEKLYNESLLILCTFDFNALRFHALQSNIAELAKDFPNALPHFRLLQKSDVKQYTKLSNLLCKCVLKALENNVTLKSKQLSDMFLICSGVIELLGSADHTLNFLISWCVKCSDCIKNLKDRQIESMLSGLAAILDSSCVFSSQMLLYYFEIMFKLLKAQSTSLRSNICKSVVSRFPSSSLKETKVVIMELLFHFMGDIPYAEASFNEKLSDTDAHKSAAIFNYVLSIVLDETCDLYSLHTSNSKKRISVSTAVNIGKYLYDSLACIGAKVDSEKVQQTKFQLCLTLTRLLFSAEIGECGTFEIICQWIDRAGSLISNEQNVSHLSNLTYLIFLSLRNKNKKWQEAYLEKSLNFMKTFVNEYPGLIKTYLERSETSLSALETSKATIHLKFILQLMTKTDTCEKHVDCLKKLLWKYLRNHYYKTRQDNSFASGFVAAGNIQLLQIIFETEIDVLEEMNDENYNGFICANIRALLRVTDELSFSRIPTIFRCFSCKENSDLPSVSKNNPRILFWYGVIKFAAADALALDLLQRSFEAFVSSCDLQDKSLMCVELLSDIFSLVGRFDLQESALYLLQKSPVDPEQKSRIWSKYVMLSCRKGLNVKDISRNVTQAEGNTISALAMSYAYCLSFDVESSEKLFAKHTSTALNDTYTCALACFVRANISKYWGIIGAAIIETLYAIKLLNGSVKSCDNSVLKSLAMLSLEDDAENGTCEFYDGFMNMYLQLDLYIMLACLLDVRGSVKDAIYMADKGHELALQFRSRHFVEAFDSLRSSFGIRSQKQNDNVSQSRISAFVSDEGIPVYIRALILGSIPQSSRIGISPTQNQDSNGNLVHKLYAAYLESSSAIDTQSFEQCFFPEFINYEVDVFVDNSHETLELAKGFVDQLQIDADQPKKLKSAVAKPTAAVLKRLQESLLSLFDATYLSSSPRKYAYICHSMICVEMLKKKISYENIFFWTESAKHLTVRREIMGGLLKKFRSQKGTAGSRLPSFNYSVRPKEEIPTDFLRQIYDFYSNEYEITAQDMISSYLSGLPDGWCVISLNMIDDYKQFIRLIYSNVPNDKLFNKFSLQEYDEIGAVMSSFRQSIDEANSITHSGKFCETKQDKLKWWDARKNLDKNIQKCLSKLDDLIFADKFEPSQHEHIVLILDNHTQHITWESMPSLRKCSVSRVPCLSLLRDRLNLLKHSENYGYSTSSGNLEVKRKKIAFLLNPDGDLINTEQEMKSIVNKYSDGICARRPVKEEIKELISNKHLFLYFGHSGAEQYISGKDVRELENCGSILLFGCSSASLKQCGEYDCYGTALDYLIAGAPCVLGNMWDVTDKDLDKLTKSTLNHFGINEGDDHNEANDRRCNISQSLAMSRDVCKLPYLTGAATVVYGLPIALRLKNKR